jgi:4-amino-4-deoxy-L-arabinose transferase-like glycosyltransferase
VNYSTSAGSAIDLPETSRERPDAPRDDAAWPFRLAVFALIVLLTVPRMAQRGMFGDGLLYATIARNLSIGVGSFWAPSFSRTTFVEFFEHPPLGFALEAGAFWLLGDHVVVERLFSLLVFGLHALVTVAIWRRVQPAAYDWLPLLFWILPSIVTWCVVNNMLENTQALFTSAAMLLLLTARTGTARAAVIRSAAAAAAIVGAVLTKGPVGFFPLVAPVLFLLLPGVRRPKRLRLMLMTMIVVIAACGVALAAYEPSRRGLTEYVQTQLVPSLMGAREINRERLPVIRHLGLGIIARMAALLAFLWLLGGRGIAAAERRGPALFFLGMGLCASLPLGVSPKLVGHYFLPSVPLFALGFASLAVGPVASVGNARGHWSPRELFAVAAGLLMATVAVPVLYGPVGLRDQTLLRDLDAIGPAMPRDVIIGTCQHPRGSRDWSLHTYVQRWYRVSLDPRDVPIDGWLLEADGACEPPPSCVPAARGGTLALFRCVP